MRTHFRVSVVSAFSKQVALPESSLSAACLNSADSKSAQRTPAEAAHSTHDCLPRCSHLEFADLPFWTILLR